MKRPVFTMFTFAMIRPRLSIRRIITRIMLCSTSWKENWTLKLTANIKSSRLDKKLTSRPNDSILLAWDQKDALIFTLKNMSHRHKYLFAGFIALLGLALVVQPVGAATSFSVESVGGQLGLGNADLKDTTLNILRWVLGIMALVAVAMIIFSGFIAVTSSDEDRAATAKRVIAGAVIGLIVVLLAWAIVLFVTRTTSNVTT